MLQDSQIDQVAPGANGSGPGNTTSDGKDGIAKLPATSNGGTTSHSPAQMIPKPEDIYYYPPDIAHDLDDVDLPIKMKAPTLACAWEYIRCVIPQYTNWDRYVAYMRLIIVGIICEFRGDLVDIATTDDILGYSIDGLLDTLFRGTAGHELMAREFKAFLLITSEKTGGRQDGELFRRYVGALAKDPRQWFRMRDCDALARFTIATALVCNDLDDVWFTEDQFDILTEIGDTMYDAVAFYKHRSEGETNSTFAYMPQELRLKSCHIAREVLWALDVAWARQPRQQSVINFLRYFGGPIHMMMRRYRFVEEGLTIGKSEDETVVDQTRKNFKLWHRIDHDNGGGDEDLQRYRDIVERRSEDLMFPGLGDFLESSNKDCCGKCRYRSTYGAEDIKQFGGVQLCSGCKERWGAYLNALPQRAAAVFPELLSVPGHRKGSSSCAGPAYVYPAVGREEFQVLENVLVFSNGTDTRSSIKVA